MLSPEIQAIEDKLRTGRRLTRDDGLRLMTCPDLAALGYLADRVRRERVGEDVYYINNAHINYSNVCVLKCRFCGFARRDGEPGAYAMTLDEVESRAVAFAREGARELHIVGGLHPTLPLEFYEEMLSRLRRRLPEIHLKAFTAVEIDHFSRLSQLPVEGVFRRLIDAGLGSLPGGGAEIFAPRARRRICRPKTSGERWLEIHAIAHRLGLRSNATMLYGHVETPLERVDHLLALRDLQDETGGFQCFVPLAFHPDNTLMGNVSGPTGYDDLRVVAVSRLLLDNFKHIKAYWIMMTPAMAQLALCFGANDLDGTVREERIYHAVGSLTPQSQGEDDFDFYIRQVGRRPVARDSLYRPIDREDRGCAAG